MYQSASNFDLIWLVASAFWCWGRLCAICKSL